MTELAVRTVHDELVGVISALRERFPDHDQDEIERVVAEVYADLATKATVTAHLIPLTLNRSRRVLTGRAELPLVVIAG